MKRALITGITGQDGSYLAEFLLSKGYEVHGLIRRASTFNTGRIDHIYADPHVPEARLFLHYGDLSDSGQLGHLIYNIQPGRGISPCGPEPRSGELRHARIHGRLHRARHYTGSSKPSGGAASPPDTTRLPPPSFSERLPPPQNEKTPFYPRSPYAAAKLYAYWMTINYREGYNLFACNGILFNHESPSRGETFVTRKITRAVPAYSSRQCRIVSTSATSTPSETGALPRNTSR